MLAVTLALAVLIGVALGLLGGGGSILTVPILVYAAGMGAKEAIAASLLVVGVTSAVAAVSHARAGRVRWRTGLLFGTAGMAGAYGGGRLAEFVPGTVLLVGFGLMMLATAIAMIRGRRTTGAVERDQIPVLTVVLEGVVVGLVTGLVGAGGGFLIVPALILLGGLPMPVAVGTSLVVISMKSFAGLAGYLASVQIDWALAWAVTGAAIAGSLLGGRLVGRIPPPTLRKGFGWFVIVMAVLVLGQQVPWERWASTALTWTTLALIILPAAGVLWYGWTRHRDRPTERAGSALTEIDMAATLKKKMDVDISPQVILGACNPPLAYQAVQAEESIGLLLPCNVLVRSVGERQTVVEALDPQVMVGLTRNNALLPVADEATQRLQAALESVAAPR